MRKQPSGIASFFPHTSLFSRISTAVVFLSAYAGGVVALDRLVLHNLVQIKSTLPNYLTLVLGGLLVFRTNTAYDRWWEGRKLWGQLVNDCRNLAIKVQSCVRAGQHEKQLFARKLISFCYALKDHLRGDVRLQDLDGFKDSTDNPTHVPAYVTSAIYLQFETWRQTNQLGRVELLLLDPHAASLMNICGACERIRKTPISISWRRFIRQLLGIYLLSLPWAIEEDMGYWSIPVMFLIGYFMVGMESIAEDVEQPFGTDEDDLKLDEICENIKASVLEIIGDPDTTPP
jgi:putative membrane protein